MHLVYFEGERGVVALDPKRIVGAEQRRLPSDLPTRILIDCHPHEVLVRNSFDDAQRRLLELSAPPPP